MRRLDENPVFPSEFDPSSLKVSLRATRVSVDLLVEVAPVEALEAVQRVPMTPQHGSCARTHHSFRGSFSAVSDSMPIFASKYASAFFEICKKIIFSPANFCKFLQNFFQNSDSRNLIYKIAILEGTKSAEICKICLREDDFLADLEKTFQKS